MKNRKLWNLNDIIIYELSVNQIKKIGIYCILNAVEIIFYWMIILITILIILSVLNSL